MFATNVSNEARPAKTFKVRADAQAAADKINATPRAGIASIQFSGFYDAYLVEVKPRGKANRYDNPAVLREDGTIAKYV